MDVSVGALHWSISSIYSRKTPSIGAAAAERRSCASERMFAHPFCRSQGVDGRVAVRAAAWTQASFGTIMGTTIRPPPAAWREDGDRRMAIDSYKWLPPSLKGYFQNMQVEKPAAIPWTPLTKPLRDARVALVTTAGINVRGVEPTFDYEREQREPNWGDPTFRRIPRDVRQDQIQTGHLHINNEDIGRDFNVAIPISRMLDLEAAGAIGSLASTNYSFMGYQPDTTEWSERYAPEAARSMKDEGVDAVVLTPV
jgi:D-proline reductase (dithiol) PrdB